jgi:hypothetical protein
MPPPWWLPVWWLEFWGWLQREREALAGIGALATVGALFVAGWYAWLTKRLGNGREPQGCEGPGTNDP